MSNGLLRILTALIGIPLVLWMLYVGGWPFVVLVAVIALLAQVEVYGLLEAAGMRPAKVIGLALGGLAVLGLAHPSFLLASIAGTVLLVALSPLVRKRASTKRNAAEDAGRTDMGPADLAATIFGAVYPAAMMGFLAELRNAATGISDLDAFFLALAVIVLVWATDTFAYYTGRAVGKRPLAPTISPKKTWEGAIGGAAGAVLVAILLKALVLNFLAWGHVIALSLLCSVLGQLGDLAESKMKRAVRVKDSGQLLPGHGGVLDRFDAMIVVAPAAYLYLRFAAGIY